jgi:hypothetical protein
MKIVKFNEMSSNTESMKPINVNKIVKIKFIDEGANEHHTTCKMIEHIWAPNRVILFHRFLVTESDSQTRYPIGAEFILPIDFDHKKDKFIIYPYYNERPSRRFMTELIYNDFCEID